MPNRFIPTPIPFMLLTLILALAACAPSPAATAIPTGFATQAVPPTTTSTSVPAAAPSPTAAATPTLGIGSTRTAPADGMRMLYVPEGDFLMGSPDSDVNAFGDEKPQHTVFLDAFWIDQTEVTNGQYALCMDARACQPPARITSNIHDLYYGNPQFENYPVVWVTWTNAQAYCQWAGRRLPSEAEWEKAARGTDGRLYPWGNNPPDEKLANFNHLFKDLSAVGSYPGGAGPYGALDMAGNAWEWVADWYGKPYYSQSPERNPMGPEAGDRRVLRGGSWTYSADALRSAYRFSQKPSFSSYEIGFRCAWGISP